MTKNDMARVIVSALHDKRELVAADYPEVVRRARSHTVEQLQHQHKLALAAIASARTA